MKTTYNYTVKKINERSTVCTLSADGITPFDLEIPIVSDQYEPVFEAGATTEEKTAAKVQARINFRTDIRKYIIDYFIGKDIEEKAQLVTISPTIKAVEGQSFVIKVNE